MNLAALRVAPGCGSPMIPQAGGGRWAPGDGCGHIMTEGSFEDLASPWASQSRRHQSPQLSRAGPRSILNRNFLDDGQVTGRGEQPQPGGQGGGDRDELATRHG
jgi:hypothetical protein